MNDPNLDDATTYKIFKNLDTDPNLSQRALSKSLGISLGKVNYCLKALIAKGHYAKAQNGEYNYFPGVNVTYENPINPEITIAIDKLTTEEATQQIINYLKKNFITEM